jgi:HK97 gp10 family phage protein
MSDQTTIRFANRHELERVFDELERTLGRKEIVKAVRDGANVVRDEARATTLFQDRTGTLRRSIISRVMTREKYHITVGVGPSEKGWYGRFVEFGTVKTKGPKPFLRTAYAKKKDFAQQVMGEQIWDLLKKVRMRDAGIAA